MRQQITPSLVILSTAIIGTLLLVSSHAATPYASINANAGVLTGVATKQACTGASDSNCVVFGSTSTTMSAPSGYSNEIFDDTFSGTTLNSSKWIPEMSDPGTIWCGADNIPCNGINSEVGPAGQYNAEYGSSSEVSVDNGLTLNAQRSSAIPDYTWVAGYISTYNKFDFSSGYVQIRAKMPDSSTGAWPSIWFMQSSAACGSKGCDAMGGELDLQESGTLCSNSNVNYCMASNPNITGDSQNHIDTGEDLSAGYHVYGMKYVPGKSIAFYLDGKQEAQFTSNIPTGSYDIILSETMAQNGTGWHTSVSSSTPSPLAPPFQVSEVQVWQ